MYEYVRACQCVSVRVRAHHPDEDFARLFRLFVVFQRYGKMRATRCRPMALASKDNLQRYFSLQRTFKLKKQQQQQQQQQK